RGLAASSRQSTIRLKAMAALRAVDMHSTMPASSSQRKPPEWSLAPNVQAITAASSAKGSANSVWLKRIISRMCRRRASIKSTPPATHERVLNRQLIADSCHDEVDQVANRLDAVIEPGHGRQDDGAGLGGPAHVLELDGRERRFARHEDQLAALLEVYAGGPL